MNDLRLWQEAIAGQLARTPDLRVCGKAFGEQDAFEKASRLHPKLVLTEIFRPQDLRFIREMPRRHPHLLVLVFSFRDEESYAPRAWEAGVCGYLMKNVDSDAPVAGIRKVLEGFLVLSPAMTAQLHPLPNTR